ncbi:hypothetical protein MNBD_GAMMA07-107 [hydrothermal vent metagenome]|uniref:L,D-TPase catalytic domain-containing protein n=1 Tax=hydrothermal vent metagenome TaxID=652676 RepID=A0A3B0X366_9ZZZZ
MKVVYLLFFVMYSTALFSAALHPEERLLDAIHDIQSADLTRAELKLKLLIADIPDFKLAQMVYGDVLNAKVKSINDVGQGLSNGLDKLLLLLELKNRYGASREVKINQAIPSALARLDAFYRHVIVVDLSKSRLYLFDNTQQVPVLVDDFFISMGRSGAGKSREGDLKTPLGVYFVQSHINAKQLVDKYGEGAYPINYPNAWDRLLQKTGSGIWLHGTRSGTYNRPALASEGCVVLPNADLQRVGRYIDIKNTPFIIGDNIEWLMLNQWRQQQRVVNQIQENWVTDWQSLNVERYLSHYSKKFTHDKKGLFSWAKHKRRVAKYKTIINVTLSNISLLMHPNEKIMVATFLQIYESDNFSSERWKQQYWEKEHDGQWRIVLEDKISPLKRYALD